MTRSAGVAWKDAFTAELTHVDCWVGVGMTPPRAPSSGFCPGPGVYQQRARRPAGVTPQDRGVWKELGLLQRRAWGGPRRLPPDQLTRCHSWSLPGRPRWGQWEVTARQS